MKLLIKQRVFTWTDTYDVYDELGNPKYYVTTEAFTFGHQIHVYDKHTGQELGSVHQKPWAFLPTFEIVIGGNLMGTVIKEWTLFIHRYTVDFLDWDVEGDIFGWDYDVRHGDRTVMTVDQEPFAWGDTYALNFCDPADEMPGLLLVLAMDAANCDK